MGLPAQTGLAGARQDERGMALRALGVLAEPLGPLLGDLQLERVVQVPAAGNRASNSRRRRSSSDLFLLSDKRCVKSRDVKIYQISYIDIFEQLFLCWRPLAFQLGFSPKYYSQILENCFIWFRTVAGVADGILPALSLFKNFQVMLCSTFINVDPTFHIPKLSIQIKTFNFRISNLLQNNFGK